MFIRDTRVYNPAILQCPKLGQPRYFYRMTLC